MPDCLNIHSLSRERVSEEQERVNTKFSLIPAYIHFLINNVDAFVSHFTLHPSLKRKAAFTLAEVLITLGIIGVVAALTMPAVITSYQKKKTVEQLKKVYATLEQAFKLSEAENGFSNEWVSDGSSVSEQVMTQYFDTYWRPYLKILKTCKSISDCGYEHSQFYDTSGKDAAASIVNPKTRTTVILNDGTFLSFVPMNWNSDGTPFMSKIQQIRVDLDGPKGPDRYGHDVFIFVIDLDKHFIKPFGYDVDGDDCFRDSSSNNNLGQRCLKRIIDDGWQIKGADYPW